MGDFESVVTERGWFLCPFIHSFFLSVGENRLLDIRKGIHCME